MDKKLIKAYLPWGLCAGIFTIAAASGLFYEMDNRLSDALYQELSLIHISEPTRH